MASPAAPARTVASSRPLFAGIPEVLRELEQVLASGRLMLGPHLARFEEAFAASAGCRYAVGVNSCTTALEIVLREAGVEGGEVIVPTLTFVATANAALCAGAHPVLVDVDPQTWCLGERAIRESLSQKTRAVILVHLGGLISPALPEIRALCAERGVALIEDCAHAQGAAFEGRPAGSFGRAGCFSFYPTKILTAAGGGMITTNDTGLNDYARRARCHGRSPDPRDDTIAVFGNDWFLDEVRSVLGWHQLRQVEAQRPQRQALADAYAAALQRLPQLSPVLPDARCRPSHYRFMARVDGPLSGRTVRAMLRDRYGIEADSLYDPPVHLQPVFRQRFGYREGMCPAAEAAAEQQLCLPLHPGLSPRDVQYVADCLAAALSGREALAPGGRR